MSTGKVEQREEGNAIKAREERGERKRKKLRGHGAEVFFPFSFFSPHKGFRTFSSIINGLLLKFKWASKTPEVLEMRGQK